VKVTYSNGTVQNFNLAAGASNTLLDFQLLPPSSSLYSAVVENTGSSPQPLIVTVNESNAAKYATTYEGLSSGGKTLVAPIVMNNYFGFSSSITCQNVSGTATPVRVAYKGSLYDASNNPTTPVNVPAAQKFTLAPNASNVVLQFADGLGTGFLGSATITADQDVICVVNQSIVDNAPADQDQLYAYNAIVK
jgi:hypothetical protein